MFFEKPTPVTSSARESNGIIITIRLSEENLIKLIPLIATIFFGSIGSSFFYTKSTTTINTPENTKLEMLHLEK